MIFMGVSTDAASVSINYVTGVGKLGPNLHHGRTPTALGTDKCVRT